MERLTYGWLDDFTQEVYGLLLAVGGRVELDGAEPPMVTAKIESRMTELAAVIAVPSEPSGLKEWVGQVLLWRADVVSLIELSPDGRHREQAASREEVASSGFLGVLASPITVMSSAELAIATSDLHELSLYGSAADGDQ